MRPCMDGAPEPNDDQAKSDTLNKRGDVMNVLVTGGAGYVGGTVATVLMQQGHTVTVLDNLCHSKRNEVPAGVEFVEADIADRPRVEKLLREMKPDGVLHFAPLFEGGEAGGEKDAGCAAYFLPR